ncbi:MAG: sulfotransferase domain-containing protein [Bacteroidia bacterium]|nr:sulfotransferase domain-containing protein [Bacteroidia bacterium]NNC84445.1 sulfotransferase domain-containing protein [Bacteroidia bacterium]
MQKSGVKKIGKIISDVTGMAFVPKIANDPPNDKDVVFLVSYPKSGSTWTQFLLSNCIYDSRTTHKSVAKRIPDIHNYRLKLNELKSPKILKSHESFNPKYSRVIYIVRNPFSVSVSYYFHLKKRFIIPSTMTFSDYLTKFVRGEFDDYGTWAENAGSWTGARNKNKNNFLLIKYADLKSDTMGELRKMIDFIGLDSSDQKLSQAVKNSSFDEMKRLEKTEQSSHVKLKNTDLSIPIVRSGELDEWKRHFSDEDIKLIENYFGDVMDRLSYTA